MYEDNVLEYTHKNDVAKGGGVRQMLTGLTEWGRGVGEMLTMADEGGRGGLAPPFLADIICEQPLNTSFFKANEISWPVLSSYVPVDETAVHFAV